MGSLSYPTESPERLMSTQVHLLNQLIVVLEYCRCSRVSWWVLSRYHNIGWCRGKDFSKILGSGAKDTPQNLYNDERGFFFSPECRQVPQVPPTITEMLIYLCCTFLHHDPLSSVRSHEPPLPVSLSALKTISLWAYFGNSWGLALRLHQGQYRDTCLIPPWPGFQDWSLCIEDC